VVSEIEKVEINISVGAAKRELLCMKMVRVCALAYLADSSRLQPAGMVTSFLLPCWLQQPRIGEKMQMGTYFS
jgi:hypothetical protein